MIYLLVRYLALLMSIDNLKPEEHFFSHKSADQVNLMQFWVIYLYYSAWPTAKLLTKVNGLKYRLA